MKRKLRHDDVEEHVTPPQEEPLDFSTKSRQPPLNLEHAPRSNATSPLPLPTTTTKTHALMTSAMSQISLPRPVVAAAISGRERGPPPPLLSLGHPADVRERISVKEAAAMLVDMSHHISTPPSTPNSTKSLPARLDVMQVEASFLPLCDSSQNMMKLKVLPSLKFSCVDRNDGPVKNLMRSFKVL